MLRSYLPSADCRIHLHRLARGLLVVVVSSGCALDHAATGDPVVTSTDNSMTPDAASVAPADTGPEPREPDMLMPDAAIGRVVMPDAGDALLPDAQILPGVRDAETPSENRCTLAGAFGLHAELDVTWTGSGGSTQAIGPGSGTIRLALALQLSGDPSHPSAVIMPCGLTLPDLSAGRTLFSGELYGSTIPETAWESPSMPRWTLGLRETCAAPGCWLGFDMLDAMLGGRPKAPDLAWPEPGDAPSVLLATDDDADGLPGLTALSRGYPEVSASGTGYSYPPLLPPLVRARKLMFAIALRGRLEGKVLSCDSFTGSLSAAEVHTSIVGCRYQSNLTQSELSCDREYVGLLDGSMPLYAVRDARFTAVRMAQPTCAALRASLR